ncbi:hypothetical protein HNS38_13615 [Lentimicrobium sp. L6]|uniref:hypothetical protein n=1 Tax=Lentimicrobium sp. L6 TaxID=2735916 RepID=UPI00155441B3|nr:hypothetical protein [Lentimicrobium sp. L6]NPD85806.1 hypothetical protein [Lentimicrobium sp. L6]
MNKAHYYRLLDNPKLLSEDSLKDLEKLISSYPYVENFRILFALNLLILDDFRYQKHLHKAAFHASDRRKLKYWIDFMIQEEDMNPPEIETEPIHTKARVHISKPSDETVEEKEDYSPEKELESEEISGEVSQIKTPKLIIQTPPEKTQKVQQLYVSEESQIDLAEEKKKKQASKSKAELLKLVRKRLAEIEAEKRDVQEGKSETVEPTQTNILKAQLIDRFIEAQPSITRPNKKDFHDPYKDAVDSTIDEDDFFVTETLAQIHKQQGNITKALEIYQKLILKNPEKSTYFAAQIQELSKNN